VEKDIVHTFGLSQKAIDDDYREAFSPKTEPDTNAFPNYYQVFSTKFPFAPDLSILDLVFNEGPEAVSYLTALQGS
jgi:WbqC-like protein family.